MASPLFAFGAHDADVDVAMLEIGRQVHGLHGDELGGERHLAHHERAEFALDEFPDAGGSIFHGDAGNLTQRRRGKRRAAEQKRKMKRGREKSGK